MTNVATATFHDRQLAYVSHWTHGVVGLYNLAGHERIAAEFPPISCMRCIFRDKWRNKMTTNGRTHKRWTGHYEQHAFHGRSSKEAVWMYLFCSETSVNTCTFHLPNDYVLRGSQWAVTAKMGVNSGTCHCHSDMTSRNKWCASCMKSKQLYFPANSLGKLKRESKYGPHPDMYRKDLYPLYVWTLPSDDNKSSHGGARERPASRKCCWRSVIRRHSADLNVYNVTSIMHLFDVHWTYYSFTERGCAS